MDNAQQLADRYVVVWNETDATRRRQTIADLWIPESEHYAGAREVRGYAATRRANPRLAREEREGRRLIAFGR